MYLIYIVHKKRKKKLEGKKCSIFLGSDGIRTRDLHVTGGVGQINIVICKARMLPLDHGDFFIEKA